MGRKAEMEPGWRHRMIEHLIEKIYAPILKPAVGNRYATVVIAFAILVACVGLFAGGRLKFIFFPEMDTDYISASVQFPVGSPASATENAVRRLEAALAQVRQDAAGALPEGMDLVRSEASPSSSTPPLASI